jgi:hypothetical protein
LIVVFPNRWEMVTGNVDALPGDFEEALSTGVEPQAARTQAMSVQAIPNAARRSDDRRGDIKRVSPESWLPVCAG